MVYPYRLVIALVIGLSGSVLTAAAQPPGQAKPPTQGPESTTTPESASKPPAKKFTLSVVKEPFTTGVSLKADRAKLSDIAAELAKQLRTRVVLGTSVIHDEVTLDFQDLPLEPAVRLLTPRVYIDYEIRGGFQPAPLGIFLLGYNDPEPATTAVVTGTSQGLLIQGHTEDTGEPILDPNRPLQVLVDQGLITVKSFGQPLMAVILEVAEALGVQAEIGDDSTELVNAWIIADLRSTKFADAVAGLSPDVRVYVRSDLRRSLNTPLRLKIVPPVAQVTDQPKP